MIDLLPHAEHSIKKCIYTVLLHLIFELYIVGLIIYNLYMRKPRLNAEVLSDYSTKSFSIAFLICDQIFLLPYSFIILTRL